MFDDLSKRTSGLFSALYLFSKCFIDKTPPDFVLVGRRAPERVAWQFIRGPVLDKVRATVQLHLPY